MAATAMAIMFFLIDHVFMSTSRVIRESTALSSVVASSRTIENQLVQDARQMVGPQIPNKLGGLLVIVNQRIPGVAMRTRLDPDATGTDSNNEPTRRTVRSDQLFFIRYTRPGSDAELEPMCPTSTSFSNTARGEYARVWYGHGRLTAEDGSDDGTGDWGQGPPGNPNRVGTDWVLCRQALILTGDTQSSPTHANGATFDSEAVGYGAIPKISNPKLYLYHGLCDVSTASLADLTGPEGALTEAGAGYASAAYRYLFAPALGGERLRVNPLPEGTEFKSWQIAQMHPMLAMHVSDFVVEFAADANNDGVLDETSGTINWYGLDREPSWSNYDPTVGNPNGPQGSDAVAFTFRHDYADNWPYLIRIRYRVHDANGYLQEFEGDPYAAGGEPVPGKWFEQIIRVNRESE